MDNSLLSLLSRSEELSGSVASCIASPPPIQVHGLKGSLPAFFVRLLSDDYENKSHCAQKDFVIIVPTQHDADEWESDLETAFGENAEIYSFPWWGTVPYGPCKKGAVEFGKRAAILSKLADKKLLNNKSTRIFIMSQRAFTTPVPPPEYIKRLTTIVQRGQKIDVERLTHTLTSLGYMRVSKVGMRGEFAVRGEVLDIFPAGERTANRIVFDFETVEQIKLFDTETQISTGNIEQLIICPMKEVIWNESLIEQIDEKFKKLEEGGIHNDFTSYELKQENNYSGKDRNISFGEGNSAKRSLNDNLNVRLALTEAARERKNAMISELLETGESEGEELWYPLLFDKMYSILDYISSDSIVFYFDWERLLNGQKLIKNEYEASYRLARQTIPVVPERDMHLDFISLSHSFDGSIAFRSLDTSENVSEEEKWFKTSVHIKSEASQSYFGNITYLKEQFSSLFDLGWRIFIYGDNKNQALRISEILKDFLDKDLTVIPEAITSGFSLPGDKILVVQENEVFGRKKNKPKSLRKVKSEVFDTFLDLKSGDYVVHVNYGIGLFRGIERIKSMGSERDYIKLEYQDQEFVFVPIEQVNMVQRYIGSESEKPRLDRIGSKSWAQRKSKVQEKVRETAEHLIDLYSRRQVSKGFAFPRDTEWSAAFEAAFPYEDTEDQYNATQDVKADMERDVPMDRLICGDVGYGKTEIAMRASFKAVMGGKQVAFLAPTTILSEQHFETFTERFRDFPVVVSQLTRFVHPKEQKEILRKLERGEIDILIGTHRILQRDVHFRDLGLLIIDEEQRFGVKDKERLKTLKTNIDCMALSATPIPRTLHMSLLKIRDMSLLRTPPQNRQPIETSIDEYSDEKVAKAIRFEIQRGGQVFFLHNRIETLEDVMRKLKNLVPEAVIESAHGKMDGDALDDIFRRFKMGGSHVLVSTTIIENGIDIPNVNTIIIDRADMYGVSQLYQLRGRVGRSDRKAYAYLFYPGTKALSEVAMKRLQTISDFSELGAGFKIAMKDMEIRGAGNLLGRDQSGEVYSVGFAMYLSLLNAAIERLLNSGWRAPSEVVLELEYTGFIPDTYISDTQIKMEVYKKIASIQSEEELYSLQEELIDRFGPVPNEVISLLSLAKIRIVCNKLGVDRLKERSGNIYIEFSELTKVNIDRILNLIKSNPSHVALNASHPNQIILKTNMIGLQEKSTFIEEYLEQLV